MAKADKPATTTELAQRLGVTAKSVTSAIERGEIKPQRLGTSPKGRRCVVDVDGAMADFRSARGRAADAVKLPNLPAGIDPTKLGDGDGLMPPEGVDLRIAQTIREWWSALRERARHEREAGKWVSREQVRRDAFTVFRAVRDAFLAVPDRVADDLAAMTEPARVRERLRSELTRILQDLAISVRKVSDADVSV